MNSSFAEGQQFQNEWEEYWHRNSNLALAGEDASSMWDVDVERAAAKDYARFKPFLDPNLPLLDLGCGNGMQTRRLADEHRQVIGADVSASVIETAKREYATPNLEYRVLDVFDADAISSLRSELGDLNVYIRTLLHLIQPDSRPQFADAIADLLGDEGTLYLSELGDGAPQYFQDWIQRNGMPVYLQRVIETGIRPGSVSRDEILEMFPPERFEHILDGEVVGESVPRAVVGPQADAATEPWAPPCYFLILRPRKK